jgi:hypothetical protein
MGFRFAVFHTFHERQANDTVWPGPTGGSSSDYFKDGNHRFIR